MLATLDRTSLRPLDTDTQAAPQPGLSDEAQEFGRAVVQSALAGAGMTFAVEASGAAAVNSFATPLRTWMLASRMASGGVSATVAPSFFGETYPAMLALVQSLNASGMGGLWRPEGVRSLRLDRAVHVFVSADRPVSERSPAPDTLLEVVEAHRTELDWYAGRVAPRAAAPGLTKVFYGLPGVAGSLFEHMRAEAVAAEAMDGVRRCFSLAGLAAAGRAEFPHATDARPGAQGETRRFDHNTLLASSGESQRFAA